MKKEAPPTKRNKKLNNRHAYGLGNGKFGKKQARIERMIEREEAKRSGLQ